jgi:hypothetical protein
LAGYAAGAQSAAAKDDTRSRSSYLVKLLTDHLNRRAI